MSSALLIVVRIISPHPLRGRARMGVELVIKSVGVELVTKSVGLKMINCTPIPTFPQFGGRSESAAQ